MQNFVKKDCIESKYFLCVFESSVNLIKADFLTEKRACHKRGEVAAAPPPPRSMMYKIH